MKENKLKYLTVFCFGVATICKFLEYRLLIFTGFLSPILIVIPLNVLGLILITIGLIPNSKSNLSLIGAFCRIFLPLIYSMTFFGEFPNVELTSLASVFQLFFAVSLIMYFRSNKKIFWSIMLVINEIATFIVMIQYYNLSDVIRRMTMISYINYGAIILVSLIFCYMSIKDKKNINQVIDNL